MTAKINWFDASTGRGSIISEDGIFYRITDFTVIDDGVYVSPGNVVSFELANTSCNPIVIRISKAS